MPFSSHFCRHLDSDLFASVFVKRKIKKINVSAALTAEAEQLIGTFTAKTARSGRAQKKSLRWDSLSALKNTVVTPARHPQTFRLKENSLCV